MGDGLSANQDEYYTYDGLNRLSTLQRGTLNSGHTGLTTTPTWEEDFNFDPAGNWHGTTTGYKELVNGSTTLDQNRSNSKANEITGITTNSGTAWSVPGYDANGNATSIPQPASLASAYTCVYDAWNRLMSVKSGGTTIGTYRYDGLNRRVQKSTSVTRDYYYSSKWQILEERVNTPAPSCPERQFVWGLRYDDDLVLRDRVTSQSSSTSCQATNERLYVLHDFFNATAVISTAGTVVERYGYDAYGSVRFMDANFGSRSSSNYGWETLYGAYRWDPETALYQVRYRYLHPKLGVWIERDATESNLNLYEFADNNASNKVDPFGLQAIPPIPVPVPVPGGACTISEVAKCSATCRALGASGSCYVLKIYVPLPCGGFYPIRVPVCFCWTWKIPPPWTP